MDEMTLPITGGCQCGAVRYQSEESPSDSNYCHCRIRQRTSGAPVVAFVEFAGQSFRFTEGAPTYYRSSGFAERGFCPTCGSSLVYRPLDTDESDAVYVCAGTLDRPADARPKWHTGIESQVPWLAIADDLPRIRTEDNTDVAALQTTADQKEV